MTEVSEDGFRVAVTFICALLMGCSKDTSPDSKLSRDAIPMVEITAPHSSAIKRICGESEPPARFRIDVDAVSCVDYAKCASEGRCTSLDPSHCEESYVVASLTEATAYCKWRGARLPSSAEWQASAIGDGRLEPQLEPNPCARAIRHHCARNGWHGTTFSLPGPGEWTSTTCADPSTHANVPVALDLSLVLNDPRRADTIFYEFRCALSVP